MEKKINYSVHVKGEMADAFSCPMGIYYVDVEHELYWFKPSKDFPDPKQAEKISVIMATLCDIKDVKMGKIVSKVINNFVRINDEHIQETEDPTKVTYDFTIKGELLPYVKHPTLGTLYGNHDKEVFYFDAKKKGFAAPILKKKFIKGIEEDAKSNDIEKKVGAIAVLEVLNNWVELDDEDIVR